MSGSCAQQGRDSDCRESRGHWVEHSTGTPTDALGGNRCARIIEESEKLCRASHREIEDVAHTLKPCKFTRSPDSGKRCDVITRVSQRIIGRSRTTTVEVYVHFQERMHEHMVLQTVAFVVPKIPERTSDHVIMNFSSRSSCAPHGQRLAGCPVNIGAGFRYSEWLDSNRSIR